MTVQVATAAARSDNDSPRRQFYLAHDNFRLANYIKKHCACCLWRQWVGALVPVAQVVAAAAQVVRVIVVVTNILLVIVVAVVVAEAAAVVEAWVKRCATQARVSGAS
jgi:hypothetical protein